MTLTTTFAAPNEYLLVLIEAIDISTILECVTVIVISAFPFFNCALYCYDYNAKLYMNVSHHAYLNCVSLWVYAYNTGTYTILTPYPLR